MSSLRTFRRRSWALLGCGSGGMTTGRCTFSVLSSFSATATWTGIISICGWLAQPGNLMVSEISMCSVMSFSLTKCHIHGPLVPINLGPSLWVETRSWHAHEPEKTGFGTSDHPPAPNRTPVRQLKHRLRLRVYTGPIMYAVRYWRRGLFNSSLKSAQCYLESNNPQLGETE